MSASSGQDRAVDPLSMPDWPPLNHMKEPTDSPSFGIFMRHVHLSTSSLCLVFPSTYTPSDIVCLINGYLDVSERVRGKQR
ncbi:hypothetical protein M513_04662 [Trichuris suis]|uniref:Uncharacterized protein n=1 Tax=Trichuris suis TaxID=68888 RepID=A0A085MBB9_9BILA|nr:hypothetical protein M513_04662 [Trichuris suis]